MSAAMTTIRCRRLRRRSSMNQITDSIVYATPEIGAAEDRGHR